MNLFDLPQLPLSEELTTILLENNNLRIERILSTGQVSNWYDQEEAEYVILLDGYAKLEYEDNQVISLNKGDSILIPPHQKHRVCFTSSELPCIWLCVFFNEDEI
jgi:cupin 2 domain-containing protein